MQERHHLTYWSSWEFLLWCKGHIRMMLLLVNYTMQDSRLQTSTRVMFRLENHTSILLYSSYLIGAKRFQIILVYCFGIIVCKMSLDTWSLNHCEQIYSIIAVYILNVTYNKTCIIKTSSLSLAFISFWFFATLWFYKIHNSIIRCIHISFITKYIPSMIITHFVN